MMDNSFNITKAANKARHSISDYCINTCKAYCCRKGHLLLSPTEINTTFLNNVEMIDKNSKFITPTSNNEFALDLSRDGDGCPSLDKNNLCRIHKHPGRSQTCSDFPIFIKNKEVFISGRCFAHKDNQFYAFITNIKRYGYEIVHENPCND